MDKAMWIGPGGQKASGRFVYFRLDAVLAADAELSVQLTASARYRLWVNGRPVLSGPCKGDLQLWYADSVELSPFLQAGRNCLAVQVLYHDPFEASGCNEPHTAPISVVCPGGGPRLALEGRCGATDLSTGSADWRVLVEDSFRLVTDEVSGLLGAVVEYIDFRRSPAGWKTAELSGWPKAALIEPVGELPYMSRHGLLPHYIVKPRPIPLLFEREEVFSREISSNTGILKSDSLIIPPASELELLLDAGQVKVAYPRYELEGGRDASLSFTYFEKFQQPGKVLRRDDWRNGQIIGMRDSIVLDGSALRYEPFWPRCFRFLRVTVRTADEPLRLMAPAFRRTGYPLAHRSSVSSSVPWVQELYRMCVETLQNCMLETYMDCPFYEQLQYVMDTRLQVLYHLSLDNDSAPAREALRAFARSQQPMGLLQGRFPSVYRQIISTFSLHFIYLVWELYRHTGDSSILREHRATCDRILEYYQGCLTQRGLLRHPGYWAFVDWLPAWAEDSGTPAALRHGESTLISLMYAYALDRAAEINAHSGREGLAIEYRQRKQAVCQAVQAHCWDAERNLYREGPAFAQYTQHAQAWAVLCGVGGKACMEAALREPDVLRVSFATSYEWFRALDRVGLYSHAREALQAWIDLIALDCKTCPETPGASRSDNHAWSALPMYELLRGVAGIQQEGVGWQRLSIRPQLLGLPDLKGSAATPQGTVRFDFRPGRYELHLPEGMTALFHHPDGRQLELSAGAHIIQ